MFKKDKIAHLSRASVLYGVNVQMYTTHPDIITQYSIRNYNICHYTKSNYITPNCIIHHTLCTIPFYTFSIPI